MKLSKSQKRRTYPRVPSVQRRRVLWLIVCGSISVIALSCVLALIYFGTRIEALQIRTIDVQGGKTISHDVVVQKTEDSLAGTYFLLVPKRFAYVYPHDSILEVLETIPRIHSISITHITPSELTIRFKEYVPYALGCSEKDTQAHCFFIDEHGVVFEEAPPLRGGALIRYVFEDRELTLGQQIDAQRMEQLIHFTDRVAEELFFRIHEVRHTQEGDLEFNVSGGGAFYVSSQEDLDSAFEKIKTILSSKEFAHIEPGNFSYIDVRFDTKVFVKESLATSTETTSDTF